MAPNDPRRANRAVTPIDPAGHTEHRPPSLISALARVFSRAEDERRHKISDSTPRLRVVVAIGPSRLEIATTTRPRRTTGREAIARRLR